MCYSPGMHLPMWISVLEKQSFSFPLAINPLDADVRASREELRGYSKGEVLPMGPVCHCHCYFSSEPVLPLLCYMILKSWNHQMWFFHYWEHGNIEPVCRSYQRDCKVIIPNAEFFLPIMLVNFCCLTTAIVISICLVNLCIFLLSILLTFLYMLIQICAYVHTWNTTTV